MIYIASPYSHQDKDVMEMRFEQACYFAAEGMAHGFMVYSPIAHCHALAAMHNLPTSAAHWQAFNQHFLDLSDYMVVLRLAGWEQSVGVKEEVAYMKKAKKQILIAGVPAPEEMSFYSFCEKFWTIQL
jgi:hypothetical protein